METFNAINRTHAADRFPAEIGSDTERLDNPVWYSLTEGHRELALGDGSARRYPPDMAPFAAIADGSPQAFRDLAKIVAPGDTVALVGPLPPNESTDWVVRRQFQLVQMICEQLPASGMEPPSFVTLGASDVSAMRALVDLTHPGPFLQRTIELGHYVGLVRDGKLAAMAGERFFLNGYREISAVCTHPDFQKRGYAAALVKHLIGTNLHAGRVPILHVVPENPAQQLYASLHFRPRQVFLASVLQRA